MALEVFEIDGFVDTDVPIFHGFFGKRGGVSKGIYAALNCGPGSNDNPCFFLDLCNVIN